MTPTPTPQVLNLDELLAPVEPPAVDPRETPEYIKLREAYQEAKRLEGADAERLQDIVIESLLPTWRALESAAVTFLSSSAKDLEVVSWLAEAAVRIHGFAGLRDSLILHRELATRFWDSLLPSHTETDGDTLRLAPLRALAAASRGRLLLAVQSVPWTAPGAPSLLSYLSILAARDFEDFEQRLAAKDDIDSDERSRRREKRLAWLEGRTPALSASTLGGIPSERLLTLQADLQACNAELDHLETTIQGLYRPPAEAESDQGPPSLVGLREVLETVQRELEVELKARPDLEPEDAQASGEEGGSDGSGGGEGGPRSNKMEREEILRQMERFADFFERTEPHSPLAPGLRRLVRWGRTPLPSLLREVVSDESARESLYRLLGIPPETDSQ